MRKLKENRKKGFTLVELIVVLVILAILAALLVPALTGYIDKARDKQIIAETRQAVMAAQTIIDEQYAKGSTITPPSDADIKALAEVPGTSTVSSSDIDMTKGHLTKLTYAQNGGKTCIYLKNPPTGTEQYDVQ